MLYNLLVTVYVAGSAFMAQTQDLPMTQAECQAKAQEYLARGYERVVCRPIRPESVTVLNLPSGRVIHLRESPVNGWQLENPNGGIVLEIDIADEDIGAVMDSLELMEKKDQISMGKGL